MSSSPIISFYYQDSIFYAAVPENINSRINQESSSSIFKKIILSITTAVANIFKNLSLVFSFAILFKTVVQNNSSLYSKNQSTHCHLDDFSKTVIIGPIIEELIFRGIIQQTILPVIQKTIRYITPTEYQQCSYLQWINSPSFRVIFANLLFAAVHIKNADSYLDITGALLQVTLIALYPTESILCETTDSLTAPLVAHMTNNFIVWSLLKV